ncbi:MAG TPA: c-type cytochrome, partial [Chthoniobacter sp.]|nr:c-type cytochrome [Chthoniobacter sp.]
TANGAPIFFGGIPATVVPEGMRAMTAKKINLEDKAHAITTNYRQVDVFGGYTAATGSAFIYSSKLPPRMQGKAMVCEPTMKLISLMDVQPSGAGYVAKDAFNLVASSDEWMSPVFAEVGPDGAVWFVDWENFIVQHNPTPSVARGGFDAKTGAGGAHENPLRDHSRGRIYRVVWDKAPQPAKIPSLRGASTADLVKALGSDTQQWRLTAQRLLVDGKKTDAVVALKRIVVANDGNIAAIHALWTLQGLHQLDDATMKAALSAKDSGLRRNAIRALSADDGGYKSLTSAGVISDPDPATRLASMVKLGEMPTTPDIKNLVAKLAPDSTVQRDEWLKEAARVLLQKHKVVTYQEEEKLLAGDPKRGEQIFYKHQVACVLCHTLHGQGSTVGPPLDGIATRATPAYIKESLLEPSKVLAKGYENLGTSPMPPMGLVLKPQELEDIQAFLQTLK